jgi:hypothetical protein
MKTDLIDMMADLIRFPAAHVCKHYVAANILSLLEKNGIAISNELARTVVNAEDEAALIELAILRENHV